MNMWIVKSNCVFDGLRDNLSPKVIGKIRLYTASDISED